MITTKRKPVKKKAIVDYKKKFEKLKRETDLKYNQSASFEFTPKQIDLLVDLTINKIIELKEGIPYDMDLKLEPAIKDHYTKMVGLAQGIYDILNFNGK
jgi:hypothetical protein